MTQASYPPASPSGSAGKQKIIIASLVIVIIVLSIAVAYLATGGFNMQASNPAPSPTISTSPTTSTSPTPTPTSTLNPTATPTSSLTPATTPPLTPTQNPSTTPTSSPSSSPTLTPTPTSSSASVAFVYNTNLTSAQAFQTLLSSRGITVDLVSNSTAATQDYSSYDLIIISYDTGDWPTWGSNDALSAINQSSAPILGLGEGGAGFFEKLNLDIGYLNAMFTNSFQTYVVNASHQIFNNPTTITIPADGILNLYTLSPSILNIHMWSSATQGITLLGCNANQTGYYPIISQTTPNRLYALWGFPGSPADMTQTGKDLFVNLITWLKESQ